MNTTEQRTIEYLIKAKDQASGTFASVGKSLSSMVLPAAVGLVMAKVAKESIMAAANLEELESKARVLFEDTFPSVSEEAGNVALAVGRAQSQILGMTSDMAAILQPTGLTTKAFGQMSGQLAKLAVDLGSFHNVADVEAFNALRSAITGETEPMKRLGVVMSQANLQAFALTQGMKKNVQQMNQAELAVLRYNYIMAQTEKVQGDAERTGGSLTNQMKRLQGNIQLLYETIGKDATPILATALGGVNDFLRDTFIPAIKIAVKEWQSLIALIGYKTQDDSGRGFFKRGSDNWKTVKDSMGWGEPQIQSYVKPGMEGILGNVNGATSSQDSIANLLAGASGGLGGGGGGGGGKSAAEQAEDMREKIGEALEGVKDDYNDTKDSVKDALIDLEIEHEDKMESIVDEIDEATDALKRLQDQHDKTMKELGEAASDNIVEQFEKVKDMLDQFQRDAVGNEGFLNDKLVQVIQNRTDDGDKLSFKDAREWGLSSEQEALVNSTLAIQKEQQALTGFLQTNYGLAENIGFVLTDGAKGWVKAVEDIMGANSALGDAEARGDRTGFEKNQDRIDDQVNEEEEKYKEESKRIQDQIDKLGEAKQAEIDLYNTRKDALNDTLEELDDFHDHWIDNWQNIDRTSERIVGNLKDRLKELQDTISSIDALMQRRADVTGGQSLTERVTGRYAGGTVRAGEWTAVGEDGPELMKLPPGTRIQSNSQSRGSLDGGGRGTIVIQGPLVHIANVEKTADVNEVIQEVARQIEYINQGSSSSK